MSALTWWRDAQRYLPRWALRGTYGHIVGAFVEQLDWLQQMTAYAVRARWPIPAEQPDELLALHGRQRMIPRNEIITTIEYAKALVLAWSWLSRRGSFGTLVEVIANLYWQVGGTVAFRIMDGNGHVARIVGGGPTNVWYPYGSGLITIPLDALTTTGRYTGIVIVLASTSDQTATVSTVNLDLLRELVRKWLPAHMTGTIFAGGGPARRPLNWTSESNPVLAASYTFGQVWAQGLTFGQVWAAVRDI